MADLTEQLRQLARQAAQNKQKESDQFERLCVEFYTAQGKKVCSWGKKSHLKKYGVPEGESSADFVVENGLHSLIIAEAKGSTIEHTLAQMKNLAVYVQRTERLFQLEFELLLREGTSPDDLAPAANQLPRYKGKATKETVLWKNKYSIVDWQGETATNSSPPYSNRKPVYVIIGPSRDTGAGH